MMTESVVTINMKYVDHLLSLGYTRIDVDTERSKFLTTLDKATTKEVTHGDRGHAHYH